MVTLNFLIAFNLGLVSTLHCWGMCGPIISAYSLGLPQNTGKVSFILLFNFGRIFSYVLAGVLCGLIGAGFAGAIQEYHGQTILSVLAAIILLAIGLHVAGCLPQFKKIEQAGLWLWRYVQPISRRFIPADTLPKACISGLIWGWLPCGLVYSMLLWNLAQADVFQSSLNMFAFGLGTLPGMFAAGLFTERLASTLKHLHLKRLLGILIICFACLSLWIGLTQQHDQHSHHDHSQHHHP